MTSNTPSYQRYWGKAQDEHRYHLLPYHCLDVAACGVTLLRHISPWRDKLTALTGLDDKELEIRVGIFFALHDLGKFSTGFQNLRPDLLQTLQDKQSDKPYGNGRHDTLGYLLWRKKLKRDLIDRGISPPARRRGLDGTDFWMMAVTGHHGRPPAEPNLLLKDAFDFPQDLDAAADFIRDVLRLFETEQLPNCDPATITNGQDSPLGRTRCARSGLRQGWRSIKRASWWLAGLAVLADWLGSNTDFFPYCSESIPLPDYWSQALNRAEQAVDATELHPTSPADRFTLTDCFPEPPTDLTPTPLQRLVEELPLGHGPQLFILEDVTGAGKTEATLILAQRLLRQKSASGLYMGLPTMATANSMYRRLGSVYRRLYADNSRPSLVLAHGRTDLVWDFHESVLPTASAERDYGDETEPAGARCNAWLADNRKKALLAEVGVGTVDQALLAILASRHQSLRLLGLMDKILIVDEVHACDAYMNCLLEHLLEAHAMAGGSAILLSATLSRDQRRALAAAFAKGANFPAPNLECNDYPLLTYLHATGVTERPMDTRPQVKRHVRVTTAVTPERVETVLARAVEHGGCACWIRNTVNDARESFEWLRQRHPDWKLDLFHARFAFADRLEIENRNLSRFG
ncbi:MAG: CRISPR-associated helicase Cas3' [Methylothermaceae bacterium]|nr:CRISPR-associated helicase Cas3' [Methylothermaceae bacterium]